MEGCMESLPVVTLVYCPLCGNELESNGAKEGTEGNSQEYHLCFNRAHDVPCRVVEVNMHGSHFLIAEMADNRDIKKVAPLCFCCGSSLRLLFEFIDFVGDPLFRVTTFCVCKGTWGDEHCWQLKFGKNFIGFYEYAAEEVVGFE